ncbi:MAG: polysaccharide biosynthesis tyrosine autokinase [Deltaproteobacteria bacterium]|jgi:tyrosine-protein kinase Etk/Wzc|nr:polysaccharide biosynthesis tyrosine autokinase [Deltaproteobacteria bacterium]
MAQYDVDLRDYWRIIKKRKAAIIFMVLLVGICSYGFAKFKEPTPLFEATSAIKVDRFSNLASILTGGYWRQSENMVTHAYIITSFPVLCQTARSMGWIPKNTSDEAVQNSQKHLAVIRHLKSMVQAEHQEGTNIIDIRVESENAREAARVANQFSQSYREYNIREKNKKTFETKTFIEEQLSLTSNRLRLAEQELQSFKESYALISLDAQTQNTLNRLYTVETEYEKVKIDKAEAQSQLQMIDAAKQNKSPDLKGSFFSASPDSPVYSLKSKLSELLLKRQTLLINFTAKHPRVIEIDDQIDAVLHETQKELQSLINAYSAREADLLKRMGQLRRENLSLPEKGLQLVRLQRDVELQESLYSQLKEKYQEILIQDSGKVEEVTVVKPAVVPAEPFNIPSKLMIVVTGIVMGLIIGIVFAFLVEVFDTSMGTIEDVEELLSVPVLGVIPQLGTDTKGKKRSGTLPEKDRSQDLVTHYQPKSMGAETFRALRTNLQFLRLEMKGKLFLITSSFVQEGKTLNVVNLALSMAQAGNKVLLVDADLRKPLVHKVFGLSREPGITDYVLGNYHWKEVTNSISDVMLGDFGIDDILQTPGMDNMNFVTAGTKPPNPTEILSSSRFKEFLTEAAREYDFIFVDTPPILPVADATEIAPLMDGIFLVYTVGKIGRGALKRAKSTLDNVEARVLGVILNNVKPEAGPEYFRYHSHYYYGSETKSDKRKQKLKNWLQRPKGLSGKGSRLKWIIFLAVLVLLALGVYWQDLHRLLPDWFSALEGFIPDWFAMLKGFLAST